VNGYPTLSGETTVVPIIGDPITQVKSPDGVTRGLTARGANSVVVPMHVTPADLDRFIEGIGLARSETGIIVTVPHKFAVHAHCRTATDRGHFLSSVNVMRRNTDGSWHGDQVDGHAYVQAAVAAGCEPRGAAALQVGAGGAGSAIALALLEAGVAELALHDADPRRSDRPAAGTLREPRGHRIRRSGRSHCGGQRDPDGHAGRRSVPRRSRRTEAVDVRR
jgi:shikimate dehydrogenase